MCDERGLTVDLLWGLYVQGHITWHEACELAFTAGAATARRPPAR